MYAIDALEEYTTPCGHKRFRMPVLNSILNRHRFISSDTPEFTLHKVSLQESLWATQGEQREVAKRKRLGLEMNGKRADLKARQKQKIAEERTALARQEFSWAYDVLALALKNPLEFSWEFFRAKPPFSLPKPVVSGGKKPSEPIYPREPQKTDFAYTPKYEAMDTLRPSRKQQKDQEAQARFVHAHQQWQQLCTRMQSVYKEQMAIYTQQHEKILASQKKQLEDWERARESYQKMQETTLDMVAAKEEAFVQGEANAILDYFDMAMAVSPYSPLFPHSFESDYRVESKRLVVDYLLPTLKALPRLVTVVYNENTDSFSDQIITAQQQTALYAKLLYEIPLRTFHELFALDTAETLKSIRFRGYLFLEENKEKPEPPLRVVDVLADREAFLAMNLAEQAPMEVFEALGGEIYSLTSAE